MSLNKDTLGIALYNARKYFDDRNLTDLLNEYGDMEQLRIAICKKDAEVIINHLKEFGIIPALGLVAPNGAVTGSAKIE